MQLSKQFQKVLVLNQQLGATPMSQQLYSNIKMFNLKKQAYIFSSKSRQSNFMQKAFGMTDGPQQFQFSTAQSNVQGNDKNDPLLQQKQEAINEQIKYSQSFDDRLIIIKQNQQFMDFQLLFNILKKGFKNSQHQLSPEDLSTMETIVSEIIQKEIEATESQLEKQKPLDSTQIIQQQKIEQLLLYSDFFRFNKFLGGQVWESISQLLFKYIQQLNIDKEQNNDKPNVQLKLINKISQLTQEIAESQSQYEDLWYEVYKFVKNNIPQKYQSANSEQLLNEQQEYSLEQTENLCQMMLNIHQQSEDIFEAESIFLEQFQSFLIDNIKKYCSDISSFAKFVSTFIEIYPEEVKLESNISKLAFLDSILTDLIKALDYSNLDQIEYALSLLMSLNFQQYKGLQLQENVNYFIRNVIAGENSKQILLKIQKETIVDLWITTGLFFNKDSSEELKQEYMNCIKQKLIEFTSQITGEDCNLLLDVAYQCGRIKNIEDITQRINEVGWEELEYILQEF